jgi:hypothetical protein
MTAVTIGVLFAIVDTDAGIEGFVEDTWLEGTLEIGGSIKIVGLRAALRCVMTTHRQAELARDLRILRTAANILKRILGYSVRSALRAQCVSATLSRS